MLRKIITIENFKFIPKILKTDSLIKNRIVSFNQKAIKDNDKTINEGI
jgi:hypothetical protein